MLGEGHGHVVRPALRVSTVGELGRRSNPRQPIDDVLGLPDDVPDDLACRFDVVDEAARLTGPEWQIFEVARVLGGRRDARIFGDFPGLAGARPASYGRTFARSLPDRRLTRRLPLAHDGVAQNAMRRVLPPNVEEVVRIHGIFRPAADDPIFVQPGHERLLAGDETCTHRDTLGTQAEGGDQASTVGYAS